MEDMIIFGSSGHARSVIDVIESQKLYRVVGLVDSYRRIGEKTYEYEILGGDEELEEICNTIPRGIVAVGHNYFRQQVVEKMLSLNPAFRFITAIHPSATISPRSSIAPGSVVMAGAVINTGTRIGSHCIVNTNASIDHDCSLSSYVSIAPGAVLGGNVSIGEGAAISIGAKILEKRAIGEHSIIGAGAVVMKDIPAYVVAYGLPATTRRSRAPADPYLR